MRVRSTTALVALMSLAMSAPVAAQPTIGPKHPFKIGNWSGGSHFYASGGFSHCSLMTIYRSGIFVMFAIDQAFKWRIGFASPTWNMAVGQTYNISYVIDQYAPNVVSARAALNSFAIAELQPNAAVFQQFRLGRMLTVQGGGEIYQFRLDGTAKALTALLDCAKDNMGIARAPVQPVRSSPPAAPLPAAAPAPTPVADVVTAEEKLDATRLVANMLSSGQLREFKLMSLAELSDPTLPAFIKTADVAWKAPGTIGVLNIVHNPKRLSLDEMAAITMGGDAASCKGRFMSGKLPDAELPAIRRQFTSCQDGQQTIYLEYIFVPRPDGSALRFGTFSSGTIATEKAQEPDNRLRNAVQEVVFRN